MHFISTVLKTVWRMYGFLWCRTKKYPLSRLTCSAVTQCQLLHLNACKYFHTNVSYIQKIRGYSKISIRNLFAARTKWLEMTSLNCANMMRNSCDVIEKLFLVGKIQNCSGFPLFYLPAYVWTPSLLLTLGLKIAFFDKAYRITWPWSLP